VPLRRRDRVGGVSVGALGDDVDMLGDDDHANAP
jgi:hypothetical protein